jgi:hypothetical protein
MLPLGRKSHWVVDLREALSCWVVVICAKETLGAATHCATRPNYIRSVHGLETFTSFHFHTALGLRHHSIAWKEQQHLHAQVRRAP